MRRSLHLAAAILASTFLSAQTFFYIDGIAVQPASPTTADNVSIDLIGNLSSSGAYIVSASAQVVGSIVTISITAADNGGLAVLVPHTETVAVGQLPAGVYTILFNSQNVADFAPSPQHQFTVVGSGSPCDLVDIVSVQWQAFTDTAIVIHVQNNNPDVLFDYPNFILFDANGDTLAKETVNFFGIAGESWHMLRVQDDAMIPNAPFNGTLELWTFFTDVLSCTWSLPIDLCPPAPCATLIPMIQNFGGALTIGTYSWSISDDGGEAASGIFEMTAQLQFDSDTICIPPGNYGMVVIPNDPPTGGNPVFNVSTEGWISGPSQPVTWALPVVMPFTFYEHCIDGTNAVVEIPTAATLNVLVQDGALLIRRSDARALGAVKLYDALGKVLFTSTATSNTLTIPVGGITTGIVLVQVGDHMQRVVLP
ncbi:MAG: hypothetical protein IPP83_11850 [Flavobacteriales bacterium]|nr:hypothetical protein [Flavobacteriales bacterium]